MDFNELLEKYNLLSAENSRLIKENSRLRAQLGLTESKFLRNEPSSKNRETIAGEESPDGNSFSDVTGNSDTISKIRLFMSLFKGRDDVYAKRWENKSKGTAGYWPVGLNQ